MRALTVLPLLGAAASVACGFAALGVALYPQVQAWQAGGLYAAFGLAAGAGCGVIDMAWRRLPNPAAPRAEALASTWGSVATRPEAARLASGAYLAGAARSSRFGG